MAIDASRSTLPDSSFSTMSSSSASAVSKFILAISAATMSVMDFVLVFFGGLDALNLAAPSHQCLYMRPDRRAEGSQVIAALKDRDNAALGMLVGQFHHVEGGPHELRLGQLESSQGIAAMSIEAGRDNYQIGPEGIDGRQNDRAHRLAETVRSITGPERRIENIPDAG